LLSGGPPSVSVVVPVSLLVSLALEVLALSLESLASDPLGAFAQADSTSAQVVHVSPRVRMCGSCPKLGPPLALRWDCGIRDGSGLWAGDAVETSRARVT
jgi:hypothetical protein